MATDVFISYSHKDKAKIAVLAHALEQSGKTVWWDPEILPGQNFQDVIQDALHHASCVITAWSQTAVKSDYVRAESLWAFTNKNLVSMRLDDVVLPTPFNAIQVADLQHWEGDTADNEFQKLCRGVDWIVEQKTGDIPQVPNEQQIKAAVNDQVNGAEYKINKLMQNTQPKSSTSNGGWIKKRWPVLLAAAAISAISIGAYLAFTAIESSNEAKELATVTKLFPYVKNDARNCIGSLRGDKDYTGYDYIHKAARYGFNAGVKHCLQSNINPNVTNSDGWTPLHSAARGSHLDVIQTLLYWDADKTIKDNNGRAAWQHIGEIDNPETQKQIQNLLK